MLRISIYNEDLGLISGILRFEIRIYIIVYIVAHILSYNYGQGKKSKLSLNFIYRKNLEIAIFSIF